MTFVSHITGLFIIPYYCKWMWILKGRTDYFWLCVEVSFSSEVCIYSRRKKNFFWRTWQTPIERKKNSAEFLLKSEKCMNDFSMQFKKYFFLMPEFMAHSKKPWIQDWLNSQSTDDQLGIYGMEFSEEGVGGVFIYLFRLLALLFVSFSSQ